MKILKLVMLNLIIVSVAFANEDVIIIDKATHKERLLKKVALAENQFFYLTVRDEGHVLGQNFIVQLRASCNGDVEDFSTLKVLDSISVCNLKPDSVKVNKGSTAVAFLSKTANINKYYEDLSDGREDPRVDCNVKTEIQKFSLKKICAK